MKNDVVYHFSVYTMLLHVTLCLIYFTYTESSGWSGGAMVLDELPVPGRPAIWITVGQGHTALAVGAGGGLIWTFLLSSVRSLFFLPLFGRRPDKD